MARFPCAGRALCEMAILHPDQGDLSGSGLSQEWFDPRPGPEAERLARRKQPPRNLGH
jgi:hypothetical protein